MTCSATFLFQGMVQGAGPGNGPRDGSGDGSKEGPCGSGSGGWLACRTGDRLWAPAWVLCQALARGLGSLSDRES